MRSLRSHRRTPLCGTHLPHFELIDGGARVDYLLRAWPDPRLFRRIWGRHEWIETSPPRMDLKAWSDGRASWLQHLAPRSRRARPPRPEQIPLGFTDPLPQVLSTGLAGFVATIPASIQAAIKAFQLGQFSLLQLLARHPRARDVVGDSPVLVMALTDLDSFRGERIFDQDERIESLLRMRQRDALRWLGFPGTNATRRILRRVQRPAVSIELLLRLRRVLLEDDVPRPLRHCSSVHAGVVGLASNPDCRALVTSTLLEEVAARSCELLQPHTARRVEAVAAMAAALDRRIGPLRSRREVREVQRELEQARRRRPHARPRPSGSRPTPPAAPAPEFPAPALGPPRPSLGLRAEPITNRRELKSWARQQRNCCASDYYARRLRRGTLMIYRLRRGSEQATLSLVRERCGWRRSELEGPANTPCSAAMRQAVQCWLATAFGGADSR